MKAENSEGSVYSGDQLFTTRSRIPEGWVHLNTGGIAGVIYI